MQLKAVRKDLAQEGEKRETGLKGLQHSFPFWGGEEPELGSCLFLDFY